MDTYSTVKNYQSGGEEAFVVEPTTGGVGPAGSGLNVDTTISDPPPKQDGLTQKLVMFGEQSTGIAPPKIKSKLPGLEPLPSFSPAAEIVTKHENAEIDDMRPMPADCQGLTPEQEEFTLLQRSLLSTSNTPNASQQEGLERNGRVRRGIKRFFQRWGTRLTPRMPVLGSAIGGLGDSIRENGQLEVVIGKDDRQLINDTSLAPFSGCAQLDIVAANGRGYVGSAAIVAITANASILLTAAHCVYFHDNGGAARTVKISPGRDVDTFPFGSFTVNPRENIGMFVVPPGWTENRAREDDWAIIVAPHQFKSISGETPHVFEFKAFSDSEMSEQVGQVSGYPVDLNNLLMDSTRQFYHADDVERLAERVITYLLDTTGGQSGSPFWFYDDQTGKRIIGGVHTMGDSFSGNSATRITPEIANQLSVVIQEAS